MINLENMMSKEKLPPLRVNAEAVARLKSTLMDPFYKDAIENSASYNTRVCLERRMRLPFLDAQTGVAQSDCSLWMHKWQRMPGLADGQLYTYPAKRWRKKRRQYLMNDRYLARRIRETDPSDADLHQINVVENVTARLDDGNDGFEGVRYTEDSKDSWYKDYEDPLDIPDIPEVDDPETDVDDYEEVYAKKKKKKAKTPSNRGRKRERIEYTDAEKPYSCEICGIRYKTRPGLSYHYSHSHNNSSTSGGGRESRESSNSNNNPINANNNSNSNVMNPNAMNSNSNTSINTDTMDEDSSFMQGRGMSSGGGNGLSQPPSLASALGGSSSLGGSNTMALPIPGPLSAMSASPISQLLSGSHPSQSPVPPHLSSALPQPPIHHPLATSASTSSMPPVNMGVPMANSPANAMMNVSSNSNSSSGAAMNPADDPLAGLRKFQDSFLSFLKTPGNEVEKTASGKPLATPSPYCDFCLGDNSENKKTKQAEELVSCADCGRSAHPTCLQFTPNMLLSVKKYRWQCIECKSCGLCGTSDNDDQLLFCDDCDRGYHMYCLTPPLSEPPEGSWSCHLCIEEYGGKK